MSPISIAAKRRGTGRYIAVGGVLAACIATACYEFYVPGRVSEDGGGAVRRR